MDPVNNMIFEGVIFKFDTIDNRLHLSMATADSKPISFACECIQQTEREGCWGNFKDWILSCATPFYKRFEDKGNVYFVNINSIVNRTLIQKSEIIESIDSIEILLAKNYKSNNPITSPATALKAPRVNSAKPVTSETLPPKGKSPASSSTSSEEKAPEPVEDKAATPSITFPEEKAPEPEQVKEANSLLIAFLKDCLSGVFN